MSLLTLLQHLAAADAAPQPTARRAALTQLARTAAVALPAVVGGAVFAPAAAQRAGTVFDALLIILRVEWLQDEFYSRLLGNTPVSPPVLPGLVPASILPDLTLIRTQQRQHIALLENILSSSGAVVPARPTYDFTGRRGQSSGGFFPDVFTNTDTALAVAQTLEDLSVRAYMGQLPLLMSNNDLIEAAARMYAVEGRHAAHLRKLRQLRGATVKPWISGTDGGGPIPAGTALVYEDEGEIQGKVEQLLSATRKIDITTLLPATPVLTDAEKKAAASEAFDEPLTAAKVQSIIALFTV